MTESKPDNGYSRPEPMGKMTAAQIRRKWGALTVLRDVAWFPKTVTGPAFVRATIFTEPRLTFAEGKTDTAAMADAMAKLEARHD